MADSLVAVCVVYRESELRQQKRYRRDRETIFRALPDTQSQTTDRNREKKISQTISIKMFNSKRRRQLDPIVEHRRCSQSQHELADALSKE